MKYLHSSVFFVSLMLFSFLSLFTVKGVELKEYPHHMQYWPLADSIYAKDSIFLESIGEYRHFDVNTYYSRFANMGDKGVADDLIIISMRFCYVCQRKKLSRPLITCIKKLHYKDNQLAYRAEYMRAVLLNQERSITTQQVIDNMQEIIDKAAKRGASDYSSVALPFAG